MLTVITGPPASGKSTYALNHAQPQDIIIDLDRIALALTTGVENHDYDSAIRACAIAARQAVIARAVGYRHRKNVWLIQASPSGEQLRHFAAMEARIVKLEVPVEVHAARMAQRPERNRRLVANLMWSSDE